jgi:hypothetical protein
LKLDLRKYATPESLQYRYDASTSSSTSSSSLPSSLSSTPSTTTTTSTTSSSSTASAATTTASDSDTISETTESNNNNLLSSSTISEEGESLPIQQQQQQQSESVPIELPVTASTTTTVIDDPTIGKYDLAAIVVHEGSLEHGHYYTFAKVPMSSTNDHQFIWMKFNDHQVEEVSEEYVLQVARGMQKQILSPKLLVQKYLGEASSINAYLLFYTQME